MNYAELLQAARGQMGPCRACPVCNGRACGGNIPGPGAKGSGTVAIRNFDAWRNVRLNMDTIHENFTPDTSLQLFGRTFKYPFFAGPVGAMTLHYGDKYNDMDYNAILVPACAAAGIAAFTGDGTNPKVMEGAPAAIAANGGFGIPTVKPWDNATVAKKMSMARESGCFALAMDIDAAGLPFLQNLTPPAGSKTVEQLQEIAREAGVPFILKGIMTAKGAEKAVQAGVAGGRGGYNFSVGLARPRFGRLPSHRGSAAGDRGSRGRPCQSVCGWRHPHRRRCVQGAGAGRRRRAGCPPLRYGGVWRRCRGRCLLDREAGGRAG